ncbi:MAG TPA: Crp/Fnr family transcriptional regulator [Beijerinckiaceae bacterium]|jgi:CRP-like cAMP-binding protein
MSDPDNFPLRRPEIADSLRRGEEAITRLMAPHRKVVSRGDFVIPQGSDHDFVHRVRSGWAGRVRFLPDGRSQFILVFLPGDLFAVKSMFMTTHGDAVVALTDLVVEQIDQRRLKEAFDRDGDVAARCIFQVIEEERRLHNWVTALGQGDADERMAHMLLEFRGRLVRAGVLAHGAVEFDLPMTQEQLGGFLGVTTVHVSRVLKRLRDSELVVISRGVARLLDVPALERLAAALQDAYEREAPEYGGEARS